MRWLLARRRSCARTRRNSFRRRNLSASRGPSDNSRRRCRRRAHRELDSALSRRAFPAGAHFEGPVVFKRLLFHLLRGNRVRLTVALLALISLDLDINHKLTQEFRSLGANLVISAPQTAY